jgi:hypothetical protein
METTPIQASFPLDTSPATFRVQLALEIADLEQKFVKAKKNWSKWYYLSLYGSIALSALAALVLKLDSLNLGNLREDLAASFAALAAMLGTVMTAGKFESRWLSARRARARLQQLRIELHDPSVDPVHVRKNLQQVIAIYDEDVAGNEA